MIEQVRQNLSKLVTPNETLILGISGGVDSMCLLDCLLKIQKDIPFELILAHINHQLRGENSDKDEELITKTAQKHKLKLKIHRQNIADIPGSLETNAREVRYEFLNKIRNSLIPNTDSPTPPPHILTAHHANDSLETVIMNLARGTATKGLCGIQLQRDHYLRPLFNITRKEIENYAQVHQIPYREDESNKDTKFKRNLIRHEIIPRLKELNPNIEKTFIENQQYWINLYQHQVETAQKWLEENQSTDLEFPVDKYKQLPQNRQTDILSYIYTKLYGSTKNLNTSHLTQIQKIIHQNEGNLKKEFGPNYWLKKDKRMVSFIKIS